VKQLIWAGVGTLALVNCGARSELSDNVPEPQTDSQTTLLGTASTGTGQGNEQGGATGKPGGASANIWDNELLPSCVPGEPPVPDRRCAFEVDGLCYDTDVEACACVVCESHLCVWGLPDDNGTYPFKYCQ
jgi:hypothetical protein